MTSRYRITLEEILPNNTLRRVSVDMRVDEKYVEPHLVGMIRDNVSSMVNELVSTKGFTVDDRYTAEWEPIADQLKEIAKLHPEDSRVMVIPVVEINALLASLSNSGDAQLVRDFF